MIISLKSRGFWAHDNPEAKKYLEALNAIMRPDFEKIEREDEFRTMNMAIYGTSHPEMFRHDHWWRRLWDWAARLLRSHT